MVNFSQSRHRRLIINVVDYTFIYKLYSNPDVEKLVEDPVLEPSSAVFKSLQTGKFR